MGVDLCIFGNHRIDFTSRPFEEVAGGIIEKLNAFKPSNNEYFRLSHYDYGRYDKRWLKKQLGKTEKWTWTEQDPYNEDYESDEDPNSYNYRDRTERYIECDGPFYFNVIFCPYHMQIQGPPDRYWVWIGLDDGGYRWEELIWVRNEWRKYFYELVHLFGGDRVIYLPDNRIPTSRYCGEFVPFEVLEANMLKDFGPPVQHFGQLAKNPETTYWIDDFQTIDWQLHYPLDRFLPEPTLESNTNIDTTPFQSVTSLKAYGEKRFYDLKIEDSKWSNYRMFDDEWFGYRQTGGIHTFYHIMRKEGILIKHVGVAGGVSEVEVVKDPDAPFTYDALQASLEEKDGYSPDTQIILVAVLLTKNGSWSFEMKMKSVAYNLYWQGLGTGYSSRWEFERKESFVFLVNDKENTLPLIITAIETFKSVLPIKILQQLPGNKRELLWETAARD